MGDRYKNENPGNTRVLVSSFRWGLCRTPKLLSAQVFQAAQGHGQGLFSGGQGVAQRQLLGGVGLGIEHIVLLALDDVVLHHEVDGGTGVIADVPVVVEPLGAAGVQG